MKLDNILTIFLSRSPQTLSRLPQKLFRSLQTVKVTTTIYRKACGEVTKQCGSLALAP
jgi:hypothetical protein